MPKLAAYERAYDSAASLEAAYGLEGTVGRVSDLGRAVLLP